jgi:hypothetical protein
MLGADEIAHHVLVRKGDPQLRSWNRAKNGLDKWLRQFWNCVCQGRPGHGQQGGISQKSPPRQTVRDLRSS